MYQNVGDFLSFLKHLIRIGMRNGLEVVFSSHAETLDEFYFPFILLIRPIQTLHLELFESHMPDNLLNENNFFGH